MTMKVLQINQRVFTWLGIRPIDDQTNHYKQFLNNFFGWFAVLILGLTIVSSLVSSSNYGTTDLNNALYAAFPGVATIRLFVSLISMIMFRDKITLLFENLQTFHDQSKFSYIDQNYSIGLLISLFLDQIAESRALFEKADKLSNKISKFLMIYCPFFVLIVRICMYIISVMYCYTTRGYVHADHLFVGYKMA